MDIKTKAKEWFGDTPDSYRRTYYANKNWQIALADAFPDSCPQCEQVTHNFLVKESETGVGTRVIVECIKCDWAHDITPYELW